jgi:hypothetical protein
VNQPTVVVTRSLAIGIVAGHATGAHTRDIIYITRESDLRPLLAGVQGGRYVLARDAHRVEGLIRIIETLRTFYGLREVDSEGTPVEAVAT